MIRSYRFIRSLPGRIQHRSRIRKLTRRLAISSRLYFDTSLFKPGERYNEWPPFLAALVGKPGVQVLEIGTYQGRGAVWFLTNVATHSTARVTCIDPFPHAEQRLIFDHNIGVSGGSDRVNTIQARSVDVLHTLPRQAFDVIYVDGSHMAVDVLMDAVASWWLLKRGGILILDDYLLHPDTPLSTRPMMAIDFFLEAFDNQYDLLAKNYQVLVRKR